MRSIWIAGATALAVLALTRVGAAPAWSGSAAAPVVASVHLDRLFGEYQRQKDLALEMKQLEDRLQLELQSRRAKLDEVQSALDAMNRNDPTFAERERNFRKQQIEFQIWFQMTQGDMGGEAALWTARIYDEINSTIAEVAQREGISVVLYHGPFRASSPDPDQIRAEISQRRVLYVAPSADLTQAVLDAMNTRYRAQPRQPMLRQNP